MERSVITAVPEALRAYHGTAVMFDRFKPSDRGTFGAGIYLADIKCAEQYGGGGDSKIMECDVLLANPYQYVANFDHGIDFDSPAVDLIRSVLTPEEALRTIKISQESDGMFGHEVQQQLLRMGYDGIIATYDDGSQEVVAFDPDQVIILNIRTLAEA